MPSSKSTNMRNPDVEMIVWRKWVLVKKFLEKKVQWSVLLKGESGPLVVCGCVGV